MTLEEAFARYNVKLKNPRYSVSGGNGDGELALCLWEHHFGKRNGNRIQCQDNAARWGGHGNAEFRRAVDHAFRTGQVIRAVIAKASKKNQETIERGDDASKIKKTFSVKPDWFGKVLEWDGEGYVIEFEDRSRTP
jgi:hypothetical protein